jgi:hypothetical protein
MRVSVIPERMASHRNLGGELRAGPYVTANQEKRGTSVVPIQYVQQPRCDCRVRTIVERQRKSSVAFGSPPRWPEHLCGWMASTPCADPRDGGYRQDSTGQPRRFSPQFSSPNSISRAISGRTFRHRPHPRMIAIIPCEAPRTDPDSDLENVRRDTIHVRRSAHFRTSLLRSDRHVVELLASCST